MTVEEITALIAQGESLTVEFKGEGDAPLSDSKLVEAVVCLANTEGGHLLLGVEDDGRVTGLHSSRRSVNERALEALVANRSVPGVRVRVQLIQLEGKTVAVFAVDQANYIVQTSDGGAPYRLIVGRGEPECRPMHPSDIASRLAYLGQYDHSAQPLPAARWHDFDPLEFERLRQTIERNARSDKSLQGLSDEALTLALGLAVRREETLIPTVAGMLGAG
jgi:ATP-dependent DNA helicase RecG